MKYCPFCNNQLDDSATFCSFCGSKLQTAPSNNRQWQPANQYPDPYSQQPVNQNAYTVPPQPVNQFDNFNEPFPQPGFAGEPAAEPGYTYYDTQPPVPLSGGNDSETIKRNFSSIIVVIIAVLLSFNVAFNLLSTIQKFNNQDYGLTEFIDEKVEELSDDVEDELSKDSKKNPYADYEQVHDYEKSVKKDVKNVKKQINNSFSTYYSYFSFVNGLGIVTAALVAAIGFWLLFVNSMQKSPDMKTGGLSTLKGAGIMHIIFYCFFGATSIVLVGVLQFFSKNISTWVIDQINNVSDSVVGIVAFETFDTSPEKIADFLNSGSTLKTIFIVSYAVLTVIFVLLVIFAIRLVSSVNKIQNSIDNQIPLSKPSAFAAVMLFVFAAISLLSFATPLIFSIKIVRNIFDALSILTGAGYMILIGVLILMFRNSVSSSENESNAYSYGTN